MTSLSNTVIDIHNNQVNVFELYLTYFLFVIANTNYEV